MTDMNSSSDLEQDEVKLEDLLNEGEIDREFGGKLDNTFLYKFIEGRKY